MRSPQNCRDASSGDHRAVSRRRSVGAQLTALDALVVTTVGLFAIAWMPVFVSRTTPRVALLLVVTPFALVLTARRAVGGDRAARMLLLTLGACVVSALLSPNAVYSLKGGLAHSSTVLIVGASLCWWSLGRELSNGGRRILPWAVTLGVGLSALVAAVQVGVGVSTGPLATFAGRGSGLFDNPVYFGSVVAGVAGWAGLRAMSVAKPAAWALAGCTAFAVGLSGSRVAVLALVVVLVGGLAGERSRAAAISVASAVGGVAAASVYSSALSTRSIGGRLAGGGESPAERVQVWSYGVDALLERPVFGWGLNHFGTAVQPRFTPEFVRRFGWDSNAQPWTHPHNVVVWVLVSLGLVGTVLLCWFLARAGRGARDRALLGATIVIALTWLLQPTTVHSLPLAMVLFGAAVRPVDLDPESDSDGSTARLARSRPAALALACGALVAGYLLIGDHLLYRAGHRGDLTTVESRAGWFVRDPYVADYVASQFELAALSGDRSAWNRSVTWSETSVDIAPHVPMLWDRLAVRRANAGDPQGALSALDRALDLLPVDTEATSLRVVAAGMIGDDAVYSEALGRACELDLQICELSTPGPTSRDDG